MLHADLQNLAIGAYVWVYEAQSYSNKVNQFLGRVIEHPYEGAVKLVVIELEPHIITTKEMLFEKELDSVKFGACTPWDAERWLTDNAIEAKVRKLVAEKEVDYRTTLGFQNLFAAMIGAPQASLVQVEEFEAPPSVDLDDEIPF